MGDIGRRELLDALHDLAEAVDGTPTRTEMNERGRYSSGPYYTEFEGWNDALAAAGLGTNHRNDVSRAELREELRRVADEVGRLPRVADMDDHGRFHGTTYLRRFDSWAAAKRAAGLDGATRTTRRIDREALLRAMRDLAAELGHAPTQQEMNDLGRYSQRPYYREWDSWAEVLDDAGLGADAGRSRATDDDELLRALRALADDLGRSPTFAEVNDRCEYSVWPYLRAFGSHNEALRAAGLSINKEHGALTGTLEYGAGWSRQRERVLERDDHECRDCGTTNAAHREEYGQGLDVHHREKLRDAESLTEANRLENLVALCRSCHARRERELAGD